MSQPIALHGTQLTRSLMGLSTFIAASNCFKQLLNMDIKCKESSTVGFAYSWDN